MLKNCKNKRVANYLSIVQVLIQLRYSKPKKLKAHLQLLIFRNCGLELHAIYEKWCFDYALAARN